ncbi:uncharacterized protein LOC135482322 [Liolophura sinensis]|uniref:uncharacterized protein LOC135482322 n=1 Tax=Liolophura sinensis TaxID=3198878 RepID=UPI0031587229
MMLRSEKTSLQNQTGQGKCAATILTESGWHYPVINERSYRDRRRAETAPFNTGRGARPMHTSTLSVAKPPWDPVTGFSTTNKQYFGDIRVLSGVSRPIKCRSMHHSHFQLGEKQDCSENWNTQYRKTFIENNIIPANRLHKVSLVNRIDQTEGGQVKQVFSTDPSHPSYWTQYKRIHDKLGYVLGPGTQRYKPVKQQFNLFTGEVIGPIWKEENKRLSGNRLLSHERLKPENKILLN